MAKSYNKVQFSPFSAALAALLLWLVSTFIPLNMFVALIFLIIIVAVGMTISGKPLGQTKSSKKGFSTKAHIEYGKVKVDWDAKDWFWMIILLLVIVALWQGVKPVDLINLIKGLVPK